MKKPVLLLLLFACCLYACVKKNLLPKTTFDAPFSTQNRKLTNLLGEELKIKTGNDTVLLDIVSTADSNFIITNKGEDTIFAGTVSRYRGQYYLSQQLNDTSYWIHTVRTRDNLVYGLNVWAQMEVVDTLIKSGKHQSLVRYIKPEVIRLHPEKKELRKLFSAVLDSIVPDTIISMERATLIDTPTDTLTKTDYEEEYTSLLKVYPNPATDVLTVELQDAEPVNYQLLNMEGKQALQGQFTGTVNQLVVSELPEGAYTLVLFNTETRGTEMARVVVGRR